jgi:glutamate dehydrogenase/leucine dehydrogenase
MSAAEAVAVLVPLADENRLHAVFGSGQVGRVLAATLAGRGVTVRVVSRHRPAAMAEGIDWRAAAERTGALLVSLENLYGYGPTGKVTMPVWSCGVAKSADKQAALH